MTHTGVAGSCFEVADELIRLAVRIDHFDDLTGGLQQEREIVVPTAYTGEKANRT